MQTVRIVFMIVFSGFLLMCTEAQQESNKTVTVKETTSPATPQAVTGGKIAPNHSRIVGTIVSIDKTLLSADSSTLYSKHPSRAVVRIDSVLGYGSAFPEPLAAGTEIPVFFKFTLSPTKDILPDMTQEYPGLSVNSTFLADVEAADAPETSKDKSITYTIYGYEVK